MTDTKVLNEAEFLRAIEYQAIDLFREAIRMQERIGRGTLPVDNASIMHGNLYAIINVLVRRSEQLTEQPSDLRTATPARYEMRCPVCNTRRELTELNRTVQCAECHWTFKAVNPVRPVPIDRISIVPRALEPDTDIRDMRLLRLRLGPRWPEEYTLHWTAEDAKAHAVKRYEQTHHPLILMGRTVDEQFANLVDMATRMPVSATITGIDVLEREVRDG